jgi:valyl-tRNA synthetase
MYAPYLPYITETLYQQVYKESVGAISIHQTRFAGYQKSFSFEQSKTIATSIMTLVSQVRKLKTERQLSLKTTLATLTICIPTHELANKLQPYEKIIKGVTQAVEIKYEVSEGREAAIFGEGETFHATVTC